MLHCASVAAVDKPLGLVAGLTPEAATGTGVAQTNGVICEPSSTGPPFGWLLITSRAPVKAFVVDVAVIVLLPFFSPVTRPMTRPSGRVVNIEVMSVPLGTMTVPPSSSLPPHAARRADTSRPANAAGEKRWDFKICLLWTRRSM